MYKVFQQFIHFILPRKVFFKSELVFRRLLYLGYRGHTFTCTVCGKGLRTFITGKNGNLLCPNCGSLPRNRRLWQLLETEFLRPGIYILDFSPSRCLYRKLKKVPQIKYTATDLSNDFIADAQYDITHMAAPDDQFDLIICYHILEHVIEDIKAMQELYRVLKTNGKILIQTPFQDSSIYEDYSITSDEERLKHFGQEDHVRIYSVSGLRERLEQCGFEVEIRTHFEENTVNGLDANETVLVVTKKTH
ncbi:class I SAM-dependent methyltransferase [Flavobacterium sp.]|uniref:class I SAM-dependent methyltransferase n=1 Tax=Flavobacterium sp. TaxID=239 RepID=UPI002FDEC133